MPRIEEYGAPQIDAQVPLEVSSRGIEEAGQMGRAVQKFGQQFNQLTDVAYRRAAQEEVTDAQVDFAATRADYTTKLNQQIQQGNVDAEKLMEDYQSRVDDLGDKYETSHGRQAFERQSAMTKGMLLRNAVNAKAHLAGEQAKAKIQSSLDHDSSALNNDPSNFPDIYAAHMQNIDDQVASGGLPAGISDKLKHATGTELAKSAIRGWADIDPDKAQEMLKRGAFDEYMNGDAKASMQGYVNTMKNAALTDDARQTALEEKARKKTAEAWKVKNFERLENNELTAKDVIGAVKSGTLDYAEGKEQLAMIDRNAKEKARSNPQLMMDLHQRMFLPDDDKRKINDLSQIDDYAAKGLISIADRTKLVREWNTTNQGEQVRSQKKVLLDYMKANLVKEDKMIGMADPEGAQHYSNALEALAQREKQMRDSGKPVTDLYNPNAKDSFFNQALSFKRGPQDIMRANVQQMRARTNAKDAEDTADKTKAALPRLPNESLENWLKRKREPKSNP